MECVLEDALGATLVPAPRRDGSRPSLVKTAAGTPIDLTVAQRCRCGRRTKKDRRRITAAQKKEQKKKHKKKQLRRPKAECSCPWYWQLKLPAELRAAGGAKQVQYSRVLAWGLLGAPWKCASEAHGWVVHHEPGHTYYPHHNGRRDREVKDDRRLASIAWARRGAEHAALERAG